MGNPLRAYRNMHNSLFNRPCMHGPNNIDYIILPGVSAG